MDSKKIVAKEVLKMIEREELIGTWNWIYCYGISKAYERI